MPLNAFYISQIRDTEDLDHFVSQHKKYVDYMKEKQDNTVSNYEWLVSFITYYNYFPFN